MRFELSQERQRERAMTFEEVETILGFPLPRSARLHQPWWSNSRGTHSHADAWLKAGWRTSRVDIGGERVVFVRNAAPAEPSSAPDAAAALASKPAPSRAGKGTGDMIEVEQQDFSPRAWRFLADRADATGGGLAAAIVQVVEDVALDRRRRLIEEIAVRAPRVPGDSTPLIREDRDAR
ncbi:MAG: hypothetical protein WDM92_10655 [Caulobacteraceae bacterium]